MRMTLVRPKSNMSWIGDGHGYSRITYKDKFGPRSYYVCWCKNRFDCMINPPYKTIIINWDFIAGYVIAYLLAWLRFEKGWSGQSTLFTVVILSLGVVVFGPRVWRFRKQDPYHDGDA